MFLSLRLIFPFVVICSLFLASRPLTLGLSILILALSTAIAITIPTTSWFGIITFLIYVGGIIVIFSYFTALSPNQHLNIWLMLKSSIITLLILIPRTLQFNATTLSINSLSPRLNLIYINTNIFLLLFFGAVLFFTLVAVVKISRQEIAPLRPFN